jgi:hypothetical protein
LPAEAAILIVTDDVMPPIRPFFLLLALAAGLAPSAAQEPALQYAATRSVDGFDMPVGKPDAEGYYRSRGLIVGRHMGDDWNGNGGGNTDLGAPVYATAHGLVIYSRDARMGWGKTVIVRHAYWEGGKWNYADSFYTHLHQMFVREGQQVRRGQTAACTPRTCISKSARTCASASTRGPTAGTSATTSSPTSSFLDAVN